MASCPFPDDPRQSADAAAGVRQTGFAAGVRSPTAWGSSSPRELSSYLAMPTTAASHLSVYDNVSPPFGQRSPLSVPASRRAGVRGVGPVVEEQNASRNLGAAPRYEFFPHKGVLAAGSPPPSEEKFAGVITKPLPAESALFEHQHRNASPVLVVRNTRRSDVEHSSPAVGGVETAEYHSARARESARTWLEHTILSRERPKLLKESRRGRTTGGGGAGDMLTTVDEETVDHGGPGPRVGGRMSEARAAANSRTPTAGRGRQQQDAGTPTAGRQHQQDVTKKFVECCPTRGTCRHSLSRSPVREEIQGTIRVVRIGRRGQEVEWRPRRRTM